MPDFHRTNINLRREDVDWLVATFGYGWTEKVRDVVHDYVRQHARLAVRHGQPLKSSNIPDPIFRDHSCWKCRDGQIPCVGGSPILCEFPHARND